jgi:tetratricopeptide (TPR) repeat protein
MKKGVCLFVAMIVLGAAAFAAASTWADLNLQVIELYQKKEYTKAIPVAQQARDAAESEYGVQSRENVLALNNLAMLYKKTKHYSAAEPLYKQALSVSEKLFGADHPDLALPLNNLAMFYNLQNNYKKADEYSLRAISLVEKAYGPKHAYALEARDRYEAMKKTRV